MYYVDVLKELQNIVTALKEKDTAEALSAIKAKVEEAVANAQTKVEAVVEKAEEKASDGKITWSYTGKELGVKGSKETQNKLTGEQKQSDYTMKTRAGNLAKYLEQNPNAQLSKNASETFASYSSKFMPKGETL